MPQLVKLYIRNVFNGFLLSLAFVGALMWFNVANLWHLVSHSDIGFVALALLVVFNTVVFSSVQFAIVVMGMAQDDEDDTGGRRDAIGVLELAPIRVKR